MLEPKKRGGGRPFGTKTGKKAVNVTVTMTAEEKIKLKTLGGSKWVQEKINEAN